MSLKIIEKQVEPGTMQALGVLNPHTVENLGITLDFPKLNY